MRKLTESRTVKKFLIVVMLLTGLMASYAQAGLIPTEAVITAQGQTYTKADLQTALDSKELRTQLAEKGVDIDQLNDRIASLTPGEIQQLNAELEKQPAGAGVGGILGVLLVLFIVFVVTDMLCATDLFTFVHCINK
jgi:uncharacterized small protein (DUF1192 family)